MQRSNSVAEWSFGAAEDKLNSVLFFTMNAPALQTPLLLADSAVCYSLSFVEGKLPAIKQQPQEVSNHRQKFKRKINSLNNHRVTVS